MRPQLTIKAAGRTDIGVKRRNNQDAILLADDLTYFVLADGMGGHQGGEHASAIATAAAGAVFSGAVTDAALSAADRKSMAALPDPAARITRHAILEADRRIVEQSATRPELAGMGATIETLYIRDGAATLGHVGDSRIYRLRGGRLAQVTEDHSVLNEELKRRRMTDEEIANFPFKNRIVRALGHLADRRVDIHQVELASGDLFMMCSDGLHDVADHEDVERALAQLAREPVRACERLVELAIAGGGPDNISVIIVAVE